MTRLAATLLTLTLFAGPAAAQQAPDLRQAAKTVRFDATTSAASPSDAAAARRRGRMSGVQRGILTALAGAGGFFAGAYIGAAIEGDRCHCDDPGLMGALIGMPIGAASAAIVTWIVTGRD